MVQLMNANKDPISIEDLLSLDEQDFLNQHPDKIATEIDKIDLRNVLAKLIGKSENNAIQRTHTGLVITQIGMLVFEYFQKMKAELLVLHQNEKLKPLFEIFLQFRSLMNFEGQNLEIDWIYSAIMHLRRLIKIFEATGDLMYQDEVGIEKIHTYHLEYREMFVLPASLFQSLHKERQ